MATKNKLVRYLVVGGISYVVEMGVLFALEHGTSLDPVQSVAISFWVGFAVAFLLQKYVAFQNHDSRKHVIAKQAVSYTMLVAINYVFTLVMVELFQHTAPVAVIRTGVIAIITLWNFVVYKKIFKVIPQESDERAE